MMMCTRCKKRPAMVFITRLENGESKSDGLCLICAKELNLPQVNALMQKFDISDEDIEQMDQQVQEMMEEMEAQNGGEDSDGNDFSLGGAPSFPFLQNLFGGKPAAAEERPEDNGNKEEKTKADAGKDARSKRGRRKFLSQYATDRPGAGDRAGGADPFPPYQEQSLSHR